VTPIWSMRDVMFNVWLNTSITDSERILGCAITRDPASMIDETPIMLRSISSVRENGVGMVDINVTAAPTHAISNGIVEYESSNVQEAFVHRTTTFKPTRSAHIIQISSNIRDIMYCF